MKDHTFVVFFLIGASLVSGLISVGRYAILRDYEIVASVPCNPTIESCFVGDGINDPEAYKIVYTIANETPACDGWKNECGPLRCNQEDASCNEELCEGDECYRAVGVQERVPESDFN